MAFPTSVNSQITDAVTQTNVKVTGEAPAAAMGNLYESTAQAIDHNTPNDQEQTDIDQATPEAEAKNDEA